MKNSLKIAGVLLILATFVLKISSMSRDMVIAYYFGDSYISDAYLAAYVMPNMIILFMMNGMKNAFVPSYIESTKKERGKEHLSQIFKGTTLIGALLSLIGITTSPFLIPLLFPAFHGDAMNIAIWVAILYFSSILLVSMNAVLEGLFDAEKQFSFSVLSQVIIVLFTIGIAILFTPYIGVYSLPVGFIIGSVVSLAVKLPLNKIRSSLSIQGKLDWLEIKTFYIVFIPIALTVAVGQINLLVDNIFANQFDEGVITYINYANRLVHFPQAIFGVTIGTIIFPILAKAIAENDNELFKRGIERGLTALFFILLPSIIGMLLLMPNLIQMIFERGAFGSEATLATSRVAVFYLGSVLFYSLQGVISKGFYSKKKGHLILIIGTVSIFLNVFLNWLFIKQLGYLGLALSSSVVGFFYVGISFIILVRLVGNLNIKDLAKEFIKIIIATIIMAICVYLSSIYLESLSNVYYIIILALLGAIIYGIAAVLLKISALSLLFKRT